MHCRLSTWQRYLCLLSVGIVVFIVSIMNATFCWCFFFNCVVYVVNFSYISCLRAVKVTRLVLAQTPLTTQNITKMMYYLRQKPTIRNIYMSGNQHPLYRKVQESPAKWVSHFCLLNFKFSHTVLENILQVSR